MEPMITISLKDYELLKEMAEHFNIFKDKLEVNKGVRHDPAYGLEPVVYVEALIKEKDIKNFIKNITGADKVYIKND